MEDWNIRAMLDSLEETGVYVIEQNTHRLLYFNRRIKDAMSCGKVPVQIALCSLLETGKPAIPSIIMTPLVK